MGRADGHAEFVDKPCDKRQLFGRPDRAANAGGVVWRGLFPGGNVLQRFREVEVLQRIVENHFEAWARKPLHFPRG